MLGDLADDLATRRLAEGIEQFGARLLDRAARVVHAVARDIHDPACTLEGLAVLAAGEGHRARDRGVEVGVARGGIHDLGEAVGLARVADARPRHDDLLDVVVGPEEHHDADCADRAGGDAFGELGIAEGGRVAAHLHLHLLGIHRAADIHGEDHLDIDRLERPHGAGAEDCRSCECSSQVLQ